MSVILGIIGFVLCLCAVLIVASGSLPMFICAPYVLLGNICDGTWSTLLVGLAVMAAGMISLFFSDEYPCPLPQLIGAGIIAVVLTVVDLFVGQYEILEAIGLALMTPVLFTTMLFPMVALIAAIFALPMRIVSVRSRALISFFTMFSIAMVLEAVVSLLGADSFMDLGVFSQYRYLFTLHGGAKRQALALLQAYMGIDAWVRLLIGVVATLVFGYIQLVREGELDSPSGRRTRRRPAPAPVHRPAARTTTYAAPRTAYTSTASRATATTPRPAANMSAADAAFLDALSAQVESGTPVAFNTKTGATAVSRGRR